MVSRTASFGKRAVATPSRVLAPARATDEPPDSRPASVLAGLHETVRPVAVTAPPRFARAARLVVLAGAALGVALSFYFFPMRHASGTRDTSDAIRPADMPRDIADMRTKSLALVQKYPRDPRSHLFRGIYFLDRRDTADAEPYLRSALRLDALHPLLTGRMRDWSMALLALDLTMMGRRDEARTVAAPLCARDELDIDSRDALHETKLC